MNAAKIVLLAALTGAAALTSAALAHHSSAMYDDHQTVTITGLVTKYEWSNPHVYIYIEERTAAGRNIKWEIEGKPPSILRRLGWSPDTLHSGDAISVTGSPARNAGVKSLLPTLIKRSGATLFDQTDDARRLSSPVTAAAVPAKSLEGTWVTLLAEQAAGQLEEPENLSLTKEGAAALKRFDEKTMHPGRDCVPFTAPMLMVTPDLKRITRDHGIILIDGEFDGAQRTVHMDIATHEGAADSIQGHSIGRWEGTSLVIDTTHFAKHVVGNAYGLPSGPAKHLVERLTPGADGTSLTYHFELADPQFLAAPVMGDVQWVFRPDLPYAPPKCDPRNARRFTTH